MREKLHLLWKEYSEGGAVLYRIYGTEPVLEVPETVRGCWITSIAPYCFSDRNKVPKEDIRGAELISSREGKEEILTELAGEFVEKIVLPDSVRRIENAAFFNCRNLRCLEIGSGELTIGSDVFNNCSRLKRVRVRGSATEPSGIKHILNRIPWNLEVQFEDAVLLYPEYYESYDTIAPAHIFGLSIEGEGFRARQCFRGDVIDFAGYDEIFGKACAEESVDTLAEMALNRLMTPVELRETGKRVYEDYIRENAGEIMGRLVGKKELDRLGFVCKNKYADREALDIALQRAVSEDWSEGAVNLLEWKQKYFSVEKKSRYRF